jgi:hypothetical protein
LSLERAIIKQVFHRIAYGSATGYDHEVASTAKKELPFLTLPELLMPIIAEK